MVDMVQTFLYRSVVQTCPYDTTEVLALAQVTAKPQAIAERYAEAWNKHDLAAIMELHTADTRYQLHGRTSPMTGKDAVSAAFAADLEAVPDTCLELVTMHAGEDHVVLSRITGTRDGRAFSVDAADLLTVKGDLVHTKDTYLGRPQ